MYLSRLILDLRGRAVRRDLADCHALHRTILSGFPPVATGEGRPRATFGVLYRVETDPRRGQVTVLVQSAVEPDWRRLPARYLVPATGSVPNPACKPIGDRYAGLTVGMVLAFRLRANPTRRLSIRAEAPERRHGPRVEARDEAARLAWLSRKASAHGFELVEVRAHPDVPAVQVQSEGKIRGFRTDPESGVQRRLTFGAVVFEGLLRIVDAEQFRAALIQGIGSAKAYGFGLLSVALPPR